VIILNYAVMISQRKLFRHLWLPLIIIEHISIINLERLFQHVRQLSIQHKLILKLISYTSSIKQTF